MDINEVNEVAADAVKKLAEDKGKDATFPFDSIWMYASQEVPSLSKPAAQKALVKNGYIEETGGMTQATSGARRASPTKEYRLGTQFKAEGGPTRAGDVSQALSEMETMLGSQGAIFSRSQLANFYLGMLTSPLVVLTGLSGTGKSRLPRGFAQLVGAKFWPIYVQPQWSDNSDLFGYTSALNSERFVSGKLIEAIVGATAKEEELNIVLLDEMNLAPVEHYFSDFLGVIETRRREKERVITDHLPLELPETTPGDPYAKLRSMTFPHNLRVVGTANMDETTRTFSPKVLDRAFCIDFDQIDLSAFASCGSELRDLTESDKFEFLARRLCDRRNPISVSEVYGSVSNFFDGIAVWLEEVREILIPGGSGFAYRTRDAICLYLWYWRENKIADIFPFETAVDLCILQKILPKISGTGDPLKKSLEALSEWLRGKGPNQKPLVLSGAKVERMLQRLAIEGATSYWGA